MGFCGRGGGGAVDWWTKVAFSSARTRMGYVDSLGVHALLVSWGGVEDEGLLKQESLLSVCNVLAWFASLLLWSCDQIGGGCLVYKIGA